MQDAWVDPGDEEPYLTLAAAGLLTVRSNLGFRADPYHWREQLTEFPARRSRVQAAGHDGLLTANTVKFFADGVIENGSAAVLEPYEGSCSHGMPVWSPQELSEAVTAFDGLRFQSHIHAIGDAGIRSALDLAFADDVGGVWRSGWRRTWWCWTATSPRSRQPSCSPYAPSAPGCAACRSMAVTSLCASPLHVTGRMNPRATTYPARRAVAVRAVTAGG